MKGELLTEIAKYRTMTAAELRIALVEAHLRIVQLEHGREELTRLIQEIIKNEPDYGLCKRRNGIDARGKPLYSALRLRTGRK